VTCGGEGRAPDGASAGVIRELPGVDRCHERIGNQAFGRQVIGPDLCSFIVSDSLEAMLRIGVCCHRILLRWNVGALQRSASKLCGAPTDLFQHRRLNGPADDPAAHEPRVDIEDVSLFPGDHHTD